MKASDRQVSGSHYKSYAIQPAEFIQRNNLNWCEGNAIKYLVRHRDKKGAEDIRKAIHYLELLLEWEYPQPAEGKNPSPFCPSCARTDCAAGQYPATKGGGCEGYISALRETSPPASRREKLEGETAEGLARASLRENMLDAKQEAPTAAVLPTTHTDPSTNCKDCFNAACVGKGRNLTCDQGCERFIPKEAPETPATSFALPSINMECTANAAWLKYLEECREVEKAGTVLHSIIELWDCIQAVQTCIEKGGDKHDLYNGLLADMEQRRLHGNQVDLARRAMLMKNAARWRYSDEVNRLIIESNGHCFTPKEG